MQCKMKMVLQSGLVFILIRYFSEAIFYQDDTTEYAIMVKL
jgi:hypothetical protein